MPAAGFKYPAPSDGPPSVLPEEGIEPCFMGRLQAQKYDCRPDITDRASLERNFCEKFKALNHCKLTDREFARLLNEIATADVFATSKTPRSINSLTRDDGTPLKEEGRMRKGEGFPLLHSYFLLSPSPGNGHIRMPPCFLQLFIVSHRKANEAMYSQAAQLPAA